MCKPSYTHLHESFFVLRAAASYCHMWSCRICGEQPSHIHDFGTLRNTSIFPKIGTEESIPSYPVNLYLCTHCGLVQLKDEAPPDVMYRNGGYGYRSSISNTMRSHLRRYNIEARSLCPIYAGDTVLDIGSNDATFLSYYPENVACIGIDPAGEQFRDCYNDNMKLLPDYFTADNFRSHFGDTKCKLVTSICMFYDLPDPVAFARDIYQVLDDNGIWTCEQSYLFTMLDTFGVDTICHEHLEYYGLTPIMHLCEKVGLKIVDIRFNTSNGGSFRLYFAKDTSTRYAECSDLISSILEQECSRGIKCIQTYTTWIEHCYNQLKLFDRLLDDIVASGKSVGLYGASTKGNFVLQILNIGPDRARYAVERNPEKYGRCTNTGVPIISEEEMRANPPDYLVVLPWHFFDEICQREQDYMNGGGQMICYLPKLSITHRADSKIILVIGATGYISSYLIPYLLAQGHHVYGTSRRPCDEIEDKITGVTYLQLDLTCTNLVNHVIQTLRPDQIIHLAGISSSTMAYCNPGLTLKSASWIVNIADAMLKYSLKTKLFIASSSELYKGHGEYVIDDIDVESVNNVCPPKNHPYCIAKQQAEQNANFYRDKYGLWISTGILFTVQSARKAEHFLLNKIVRHIWDWKNGDLKPLQLGYLDTWRNMIHPDDVVTAIDVIMNQSESDTYVIAGTKSVPIRTLVEQLYHGTGIDIYREIPQDPRSSYCDSTGQCVISCGGTLGLDSGRVDIRGVPSKLYVLGWSQKYTIADIMKELLEATGYSMLHESHDCGTS